MSPTCGGPDPLNPRLSPGGVIVLDDFCWSTSAAQDEAETEWSAAAA